MTIFVGAFAVDLLTGQLLAEGTGGDKAKIAKRASEALLLVAAAQDILQGNTAAGINAGAAAIAANTALNAAESLAVQNLASLAAQQLALQATIAGGTLLGQAANAIAQNVLAEISKVCVAEGGTDPSTPAAAAPPAVAAAPSAPA